MKDYFRIFLFVSLVIALPCRADVSSTYRISHVRGKPQITSLGKGKSRLALVGELIFVGEILTTHQKEEVEMVAEDTSTILITENSVVRLAQDPNAIQSISLDSGKLAGESAKLKIPASGHDSAVKYRFLVRTKGAVMGVRGTQFVVESEGENGHSDFHIVDGVVDVAKDMDSLLTHNFVVVSAGHFVEAVNNHLESVAIDTKQAVGSFSDTVTDGVSKISAALPFDLVAFLADLNTSLPDEFHLPFLTGEQPTYKKQYAWFHLSSFELYSGSYFSDTNVPASQQGLGFGLSWNPTFHVIPNSFDLRLQLGSPRLFQSGLSLSDNFEWKILSTFIFKQTEFFEFGPAYHFIRSYGGSYGLNANGGLWFGDKRVLNVIDRAFFGITWLNSPYADSANPANQVAKWEFRFGIGMTLF